MTDLEQILIMVAIASFLLGAKIGYHLGFRSTKFRGIIKGRHNVKAVKNETRK